MNIEFLLEKLKEKGYKATLQRKLILEALNKEAMPRTAQEVHKKLLGVFPGISFDTVYRNLVLLDELGIVNRLNLKTKFNAKFEIPSDHHFHHFICLSCGKNFPIDCCPFDECFRKELKNKSYTVINHAFEVYGYCNSCQVDQN